MIKCPLCNTETEHLRVYSRCSQSAKVNVVDGELQITEYDAVNEIYETLAIECPNCDGELTNEVNQ